MSASGGGAWPVPETNGRARHRASVVIPTHDHSRVLERTLRALGRQSLPASDYEVIVVLDGCTDDTAPVVAGLDVPYELRVLEQPAAGAATARNRGAAAARAEVVLFLDDDMEASPELLAAHLSVHDAHPGGVVLGYFPLELTGRPSPYAVALKRWWDDSFASMSQPAHRFTFRDFCTGNVSLPRPVFEAAGGFDESFPGASTEDYEIGARLLKKRVRMRFSREAMSLHCDAPTRARMLRRAAGDGRGQTLLARRHPELVRWLKLGGPPGSTPSRLYWRVVWTAPVLASFLAGFFRLLLVLCETLGWTGPMWRFFGGLDVHAYWTAVRRELGSFEAWQELLAAADRVPADFRELEVDLATDLGRLESLLEAEPVDALRLRFRDGTLGTIGPLPAAEPLRYPHVRFELVKRLGVDLLGLLLLDWLATRRSREPSEAETGATR